MLNIAKDTNGQIDYYQIERNELLRSVDRNWIDHIDAMDQLRKGIGLRGYAHQDPVISYKQEGYEMFEEMIDRIQTTTISRLLKGRIIRIQQGRQIPIQRIPAPSAKPENKAIGEGDNAPSEPAKTAEQPNDASQTAEQPAPVDNMPAPASKGGAPVIGDAPQSPAHLMANIGGKAQPKVNSKSTKVGRNDPCPCGSGKKYKDCCYWNDHK
ncbi:MAG: SEC-C domain-containing protein [Clostridiales bacterium]|nr:SEC-C domain-containing protein [Clostridiales bacterium]